jgi:hypothetical protein
MFRRQFLAALPLSVAFAGSAFAQQDAYHTVEPKDLPLDKPGVYTLHFRYAPPRIITVDFPTGKKPVWYMFFQVYNKTPLPQDFFPEFELVTKDLNTRHLDEPQPLAVEAIRQLEDRTGALKLQTSVSIMKNRIPVTPPDSFPKYVSGIAVWTDVPERAAQTNRFSVYVSGLSDGVVTVDTADGGKLVKKKVLRLDFYKPTDSVNPGVGDIKYEDNGGLGGEKWDYIPASKKPKQ